MLNSGVIHRNVSHPAEHCNSHSHTEGNERAKKYVLEYQALAAAVLYLNVELFRFELFVFRYHFAGKFLHFSFSFFRLFVSR